MHETFIIILTVILYTNQSEQGLLDEAFNAEFNDYIKKENDALHYTLLLRRIKKAVDKHRLELMAGNLVNEKLITAP